MDEKEQKRTEKHRKVFKVLRVLEKCLLRFLFPYKKHGHVEPYHEGPLLIIGNHYSIWDVAHAAMATDLPVHFMAKSELWSNKFGAFCMEMVQGICVNRDGSDVQAVKTCMRYLKNGEVINIFPEGTRNYSYDSFLPFKGGAAALAIKTRTPIIPVVHVEKIRLFHRVDVIYGEPIELTQYYGKRLSADELAKIDEWLRDVMYNMRQAFIDKYNLKFKPIKPKKNK